MKRRVDRVLERRRKKAAYNLDGNGPFNPIPFGSFGYLAQPLPTDDEIPTFYGGTKNGVTVSAQRPDFMKGWSRQQIENYSNGQTYASSLMDRATLFPQKVIYPIKKTTNFINKTYNNYEKQYQDSTTTIAMSLYLTHLLENPQNKNYDEKTQRYYSYPSIEGGPYTVGDGLKLYPKAEWTQIYNSQGFLTKEQHDNFVKNRIISDYIKAKEIYNKRFYNGSWDSLTPLERLIPIDIQYNVKGGLKTFPEFMKALNNRDIEKQRKESQRKAVINGDTVSLGRNKIIDEMVFNKKIEDVFKDFKY